MKVIQSNCFYIYNWLDVYYGDTYVNPTNIRVENGKIYDSKGPNLPFGNFNRQ